MVILFVFLLFIFGSFFFRTPKGVAACGLFGYSGKDPVDLLRLRYLATENQSRGDHSTGVYGDHLYKKAVAAREFVLDDKFYDAVEGTYNVIGHTRHATMGAKTDKNAHPFEIFKSKKHGDPEVIGTHNGMLFDSVVKKLAEKYSIEVPDVDSIMIYELLVRCNFDYDEALSQIEGAMALAFIRPSLPEHLYLYHRTSRPLHVGFIDGNLWYSSEDTPLYLIGCDAIAPLQTDNLYVFKKGALVEVSAVKKPQITSIREDQGITTWLNTATHQEKVALGLCGVNVTNQNAGAGRGRQMQIPIMTQGGGDGTTTTGTESTTRSSGGNSSAFRPKSLSLLEGIERIYTYETLKSPERGKYYASGNNNSCYFVFQLFASSDHAIKLPAWLVRVKDTPLLMCMSAHNGLGVIEIPMKLCNEPIEIEIFNPMKPDVIYTTTIDKPKMGRVLEVALFVPFRTQEEEEKESTKNNTIGFVTSSSETRKEGPTNGLYSFSEWLSHVQSISSVDNGIQGPKNIQRVLEGWVRSTELSETSGLDNTRELRINSVDGVLEYDYNPKTDILGMDAYTTGTTLDELNEIMEQAELALSSIDDAAQKSHKVLVDAKPFLEFLQSYFTNRLDSMDSIEYIEPEEPEGRGRD